MSSAISARCSRLRRSCCPAAAPSRSRSMLPRWWELLAVGRTGIRTACARSVPRRRSRWPWSRLGSCSCWLSSRTTSSDLRRRGRALRSCGARHRAGARCSRAEGDESSIDASATVQAQIQDAMEGYDLQVEVSSKQGAASDSNRFLLFLARLGPIPAPCTTTWPSLPSIAGVSWGAGRAA